MAFAAVLDTLSCIQRSFAARCSVWPNAVGADPQLVPLCRQPLVGEVGPEGEVADLVDAALAPCGEPVDEHVGVTTAGAGRMPAAAFLAGDGSTWERALLVEVAGCRVVPTMRRRASLSCGDGPVSGRRPTSA